SRPAPVAVGGDMATMLAARQREISVSEFFAKNRHLLGFDNPAKALLTTVREAVDNALDACEEADLLPQLHVELEQIREDRFRVIVEDNGPGIVRAQVPKIFGKLLYGSRFHTMKQSRGQQGIGISAAGMYGLLTTGRPVVITSRTGKRKAAHQFEVAINTKKNAPDILRDEQIEWEKPHGTRVEITLEGTYKKGRHSIDGYLKQVAVANPHAQIVYVPPVRKIADEEEATAEPEPRVVYERMTDRRPPEAKEIRPHPHGVELGIFLKMLQDTKARNLRGFLQTEFSRVGNKVIADLMRELAQEAPQITPKTSPKRIARHDAEVLHQALGRVKIMAPPTDCLSPIGEDLLQRALESRVEADFYATVTRPPSVYRGNPFQIEVGLAYGGKQPADELAQLYRYANRVPLQYQRGACAMTRAVTDLPWRNYKISQARGALPTAPMVLAVHIASVWVPFTSESKEAVAHYPEIMREIRLALQECGRRLAAHISKRRRIADEEKKRSYIAKYIPQIGIALQEILGLTDRQRDRTVTTLTDVLERSRKM
ncbi:MAG: DNA topoisomerase VI subunit B, partial [Candidatus Eisenbacteria bacterium]|nr:DNA topoisomerase VI subunit B [Candidatus Eisenbacteria bacterium]